MIGIITYVCKACGSVFSGRASCCCHCGPSWYGSPVCCSDSSDSPDKRLYQKHFCHCTCRPCSACLYSAESQWIDGRTSHERISLSARSLWEEREDIGWYFEHETLIFFKQQIISTQHILLWIERLGCIVNTVSGQYFLIDFIIFIAWHPSDCLSVTPPKSVSLCLTLVCSQGLFSEVTPVAWRQLSSEGWTERWTAHVAN